MLCCNLLQHDKSTLMNLTWHKGFMKPYSLIMHPLQNTVGPHMRSSTMQDGPILWLTGGCWALFVGLLHYALAVKANKKNKTLVVGASIYLTMSHMKNHQECQQHAVHMCIVSTTSNTCKFSWDANLMKLCILQYTGWSGAPASVHCSNWMPYLPIDTPQLLLPPLGSLWKTSSTPNNAAASLWFSLFHSCV